jgi:hypothetical protein
MKIQEFPSCIVCFSQLKNEAEAVNVDTKINAEMTLFEAIESQKKMGNVRITHTKSI